MYDEASISTRDAKPRKQPRPTSEGPVTRTVLLTVAIAFLCFIVIAPLLVVFIEAMRGGVGAYFSALSRPD
jgi:sulfate transport system permease protein